jgi:hypothetical protein
MVGCDFNYDPLFFSRHKSPHPKVRRIPHRHRPLHRFGKLDAKSISCTICRRPAPARLSAALEGVPWDVPPAQHRSGHRLDFNRPGKALLIQQPSQLVLGAADLQAARIPLERAYWPPALAEAITTIIASNKFIFKAAHHFSVEKSGG